MVQKYIRCMGKEHQIATIPFELGLIWHHCSKTFNLPIVTTYAALVLSNWRLLDPALPPSLENLDAVHGISGLGDECWFYRVHVAIECAGGRVLQRMFEIEQTTATETSTLAFLLDLQQVLVDMTRALTRMREGCDPKRYWDEVRIFLGGYTADTGLPDGINIRDTDIKNIKYGGGSGAQSSLIQAIDEFLGVQHPSERSTHFLMQQRAYMPTRHVEYLTQLSTHRSLRSIVQEKYSRSVAKVNNAVASAAASGGGSGNGSGDSSGDGYTSATTTADSAGSVSADSTDEETDAATAAAVVVESPVTTRYNAVMQALSKFRAAHYGIVNEYVIRFTAAAKQAAAQGDHAGAAEINKNNIFGEGGTGGTVLKMLEEYRKHTVSTQIRSGGDGGSGGSGGGGGGGGESVKITTKVVNEEECSGGGKCVAGASGDCVGTAAGSTENTDV